MIALINCNHGIEVENLRGGRRDQGWIGHWMILVQDLLNISGSYTYANMSPCPWFDLCIPGSGSICILVSIRHLTV